MESLGLTPAFWAGRRVLVTGHTGFKGGWLCLWLQHLGAEVTGYALEPPTQPNLFEAARVGEGMRSVLGDVRDFDAFWSAVREYQPEIIFHLAAQPLVLPAYRQPLETYAINVLGTVHLLEAVRRTAGVRAVVNVTSDKCYENREWVAGYREDEPMGGYDPYSSSKGCAELVTAAYRRSFFNRASDRAGVALASARAGNVIGGGGLGGRPFDTRCDSFFSRRSAGHAPPPGRRSTLAACAGAVERLSEVGGTALAGWSRLCRRLELRAAR